MLITRTSIQTVAGPSEWFTDWGDHLPHEEYNAAPGSASQRQWA